MIFALDSNGDRIKIDDAMQDKEYKCIVCGYHVLPCMDGIPQFKHLLPCKDKWRYDTSIWRRQWMEKYPEYSVEKTFDLDGKRHIVDVVSSSGVAILFQEETLTREEFNERNKFYTDLGLRVVWVFNKETEYKNKELEEDPNKPGLWLWKNCGNTLEDLIPQSTKNISILLYLGDEYPRLLKIDWAINNGDTADYFRFISDGTFSPCITSRYGLEEVFGNKYDRVKTFARHMGKYQIKRSADMCSKDRARLYSKNCATCEHCGCVEIRKGTSKMKGGTYYYCYFPNSPGKKKDGCVSVTRKFV